jgi:hypothetical protein
MSFIRNDSIREVSYLLKNRESGSPPYRNYFIYKRKERNKIKGLKMDERG